MPRKRINDELRDVALNLKVTQAHRDKLTAITTKLNNGSDTQTIIQMIDDKAASLNIKPKPRRKG